MSVKSVPQGKLLGPGADALGARLGEFLTPPAPAQPTVLDAIATWRHGNMTLLLARTADVLVQRGVEPRPIPIAVLFPLLEAASLVDDVDLREMWAQLLASGVEADEHQHPMWVRILAQMSGEDARAFSAVCAEADAFGIVHANAEGSPAPKSDRYATLVRLMALDIIVAIRWATSCSYPPDYKGPSLLEIDLDAAPTDLGAQFRRAVMPRP